MKGEFYISLLYVSMSNMVLHLLYNTCYSELQGLIVSVNMDSIYCSHRRFRATLYQCPETSGEREQMTVAVSNRIRDLESVLHTTEEHSFTQLQEVAVDIESWETKVGSSLNGLSYSPYLSL